MTESNAPNFRDADGVVKPVPCQFQNIQLDALSIHCYQPADLGRGLALCKKHAREIADAIRYVSLDRAEKVIRFRKECDLDNLRRENRRLALELEVAKGTTLSQQESPRHNRKQSPTDPGFVYYLRIGGYYKIGWTSDLQKRMRDYYPDSELLAVEPSPRSGEKKILTRFNHHRAHGNEWFTLAPDIKRHIEQVVAKHGPAPAVQFQAKPVEIPMPDRINKRTGPTPRGWTGAA